MYLPDRLVPTVKLRYTPDHGFKPVKRGEPFIKGPKYFNVSDDAYRDALPRLEEAGLIKVWRAPGKRAQVEIVRTITPEGELDP